VVVCVNFMDESSLRMLQHGSPARCKKAEPKYLSTSTVATGMGMSAKD